MVADCVDGFVAYGGRANRTGPLHRLAEQAAPSLSEELGAPLARGTALRAAGPGAQEAGPEFRRAVDRRAGPRVVGGHRPGGVSRFVRDGGSGVLPPRVAHRDLRRPHPASRCCPAGNESSCASAAWSASMGARPPTGVRASCDAAWPVPLATGCYAGIRSGCSSRTVNARSQAPARSLQGRCGGCRTQRNDHFRRMTE